MSINVDQPETIPPLPEECEALYSLQVAKPQSGSKPKPESELHKRTFEDWLKISLGILAVGGAIFGAVYWLASLRGDVSTLISNFAKLEKHQDDTDKKIDQELVKVLEILIKRAGNGTSRDIKGDLLMAVKLFGSLNIRHISEAEVSTLRVSLSSVPIKDVPDVEPIFWEMASHLINYPFYNNFEKFAIGPVPPCLPIPGTPISNVFDGTIFTDCEIRLDGKSFRRSVFRHVLVRYGGGPLTLEQATFEICHFELHLAGNLPPSGTALGKLLLAQNVSGESPLYVR